MATPVLDLQLGMPGDEAKPTSTTERRAGDRVPGDQAGVPVDLSAFSGISPHFRPRRHLMPAHHYRAEMTVRFDLGVCQFNG
ncbi:hypothetical protein ACFYO2_49545 [Streptomyces sp. NPDC006602]|uniref:hypothetical protein n=1 Tax=Streptomyces sp. NPDC006602 TaxID=3364751 RepID=UPI0036802B74